MSATGHTAAASTGSLDNHGNRPTLAAFQDDSNYSVRHRNAPRTYSNPASYPENQHHHHQQQQQADQYYGYPQQTQTNQWQQQQMYYSQNTGQKRLSPQRMRPPKPFVPSQHQYYNQQQQYSQSMNGSHKPYKPRGNQVNTAMYSQPGNHHNQQYVPQHSKFIGGDEPSYQNTNNAAYEFVRQNVIDNQQIQANSTNLSNINNPQEFQAKISAPQREKPTAGTKKDNDSMNARQPHQTLPRNKFLNPEQNDQEQDNYEPEINNQKLQSSKEQRTQGVQASNQAMKQQQYPQIAQDQLTENQSLVKIIEGVLGPKLDRIKEDLVSLVERLCIKNANGIEIADPVEYDFNQSTTEIKGKQVVKRKEMSERSSLESSGRGDSLTDDEMKEANQIQKRTKKRAELPRASEQMVSQKEVVEQLQQKPPSLSSSDFSFCSDSTGSNNH